MYAGRYSSNSFIASVVNNGDEIVGFIGDKLSQLFLLPAINHLRCVVTGDELILMDPGEIDAWKKHEVENLVSDTL